MGMDLITATFTTKNFLRLPIKYDDLLTQVTEAVRALDEKQLRADLIKIDPGGYLGDTLELVDEDDEDGEDDGFDTVTAELEAGGEVYASIFASDSYFRLEAIHEFVGMDEEGDPDLRLLVIAGGGSWGDDPFDGFNSLCYFISACEIYPDLAERVGFLGAGVETGMTL